MKSFIEIIIQKRNKHFKFDKEVTTYLFFTFLLHQLISLARGALLIFNFKLPKWILLGKNVTFDYLKNIYWGKFLKIGSNAHLSALGKKGIIIGKNVSIGAYSKLIVSTSLNHLGEYIYIGNNVGLGEFSYLGGAGGLSIGDDCIIGQYFSCHPENHNFTNKITLIRLQGVNRKGISIGRNCWIGSKVTILDGVKIGNNCVIAAGSVVTKSFPENSLIGGIPAKIIKMIH